MLDNQVGPLNEGTFLCDSQGEKIRQLLVLDNCHCQLLAVRGRKAI